MVNVKKEKDFGIRVERHFLGALNVSDWNL